MQAWFEPSIVSDPNYQSFIIINRPSDATLQSQDTDGDGLNDYEEMFTYYTDPKDPDTDDGSTSDYDEVQKGTDPLHPADDNETGVSYKPNKITVNNKLTVTGNGRVVLK